MLMSFSLEVPGPRQASLKKCKSAHPVVFENGTSDFTQMTLLHDTHTRIFTNCAYNTCLVYYMQAAQSHNIKEREKMVCATVF